MTLDEAIKHCEEVAGKACASCSTDHIQLKNWLEELKLLRKYITRGGFIQDINGKWCKEGDKVFYHTDERVFYEPLLDCNTEEPWNGVLFWNKDHCRFEITEDVLKDSSDDYSASDVFFELVEPCEPDVCKDFEESV